MKKKLVGLIVLLLALGSFDMLALADGSYEITSYDVNVDLQKDGSGEFKEEITYDFDGSFNGVFYNLDRTGIKDVTNIEVTVKGQDGQESAPFTQNDSEKIGTYQLTEENNFLKFKVFQKANDEQKTVVYRYKIPEVVTNYTDTAEFNGRLIGAGWEDPIDNIIIHINLPQAAEKGTLRAWAHGDLSGKIAVIKDKKVQLEVPNNPSNTFVEARVIFPTAVTPDNPNVKNEKRLAKIMAEEKEMAEAANRKRQTIMWIFIIIAVVSVVVAVVGSILGRKIAQKNKFKDLFVPEHLYELPEDMTPAVMYSATKNKAPRTTEITATLMDLVRKKQVTIDEIEIGKSKKEKTTFLLKKVPNPPEITLLSHEKYLMTWLFDQVGNGEAVTLKMIEDYGKKDQKKAKKFTDSYKKWQDKVKLAADEKGYISKTNTKALTFISVYSIFLFILLIVTLILMGTLNAFYPLIMILLFVVSVINAVQWIGFFPVRTLEGETAVRQWQAFSDMLRDVSNLKMADVGSLIIWDHFLVYAISLGVSTEVIKALALQFPAEALDSMTIGHYYLYGAMFHSNFGSSLNSGFETSFNNAMGNAVSNASSASGTGGGFSGGSSGGFGGGSGGGAF
ncbi:MULTISPECIES: DUF2207 domain-containing protein [Carnobacterium]|uniref:DUF2207 domain-containing protein n=1 Tax=Carnobacterium TaxID=2747 RepID=UPI00191BA5AA|nr:DUF2207 domain-containing protein [Carnobacterium maltaromaticum]CAD5898685.1 conserved membrane hypothetical protein [Carnobacterium maltaromaticum]